MVERILMVTTPRPPLVSAMLYLYFRIYILNGNLTKSIKNKKLAFHAVVRKTKIQRGLDPKFGKKWGKIRVQ